MVLSMQPFAISAVITETHFALHSLLDMKAARPLKEQLQAALKVGRPVVIDASLVERVSTACVQILSAFALTAAEAGTPVKLVLPSQSLRDAFESLGLGASLQQWKVE